MKGIIGERDILHFLFSHLTLTADKQKPLWMNGFDLWCVCVCEMSGRLYFYVKTYGKYIFICTALLKGMESRKKL